MSLKSIDMQLAVHKSPDAGQLQNQLLHKPESDLASLAQAGMKAAEAGRKRSGKVNETAESKIRGRNKGKEPNRVKTAGRREASETRPGDQNGEGFEHPYKGHHIDLTL